MRRFDGIDDRDDFIGNPAVGAQEAINLSKLGTVGQFPIKHEVNDLFKSGLFGQIVDVVATIEQFSDLAVDEAGLGGVHVNVHQTAMNFGLFGHQRSPW